MTKIMLVEDDNNLREIYEARLSAEGYDIVSAQDGEAALAIAGKEHPDLIITDVMMPKISGFEMLDILRNTEALRDVKVIMLTALGQAEDNARAGALGADRYLVKSQVTLEDIVKATQDVLNITPPQDLSVDAPAESTEPEPPTAPAPEPPADAEPPQVQPIPPAEPVLSAQPEPAAAAPVESVAPAPAPAEPIAPIAPVAPIAPITPVEPDAPTTVELPPVVTPVTDAPAQPDIAAAEQQITQAPAAAEEESTMRAQIEQFLEQPVAPVAATPQDPVATPLATAAAPPADAPTPDPVAPPTDMVADPLTAPAVSDDVSSDDTTPLSDMPDVATDINDTPVPDEPESEYEKDDQAPDQGIFPVQRSAEPSDPVQPAPVAQPAAEPAPVVDQPAPDLMQPEQAPMTMPSPAPNPAPTVDDTPSVSVATPTHGGSVTSRVLQPLHDTSRPDINQLLAAEEARAAAEQAAGAMQPGVTQPGVAQPQSQPQTQSQPQPPAANTPWQMPTDRTGIDPNSISL